MSMNKVFEYCALGIPTACYPLKETQRLLGDAGVYAPSHDPAGLAEACLKLMQDEALRARSAASAAKLSAESFLWENEARKYVATYERVLVPTDRSAEAVSAASRLRPRASPETRARAQVYAGQ